MTQSSRLRGVTGGDCIGPASTVGLRGLELTVPVVGRQGVLSLPRVWTSPLTGPRRGEVAREPTPERKKKMAVFECVGVMG